MVDESSNFKNGLWVAGAEIWCNLKGKYMHIIADLSNSPVFQGGNKAPSICALGVIGTYYKRPDTYPLPAKRSLEIGAGNEISFNVYDIVSEFYTGTEFQIRVRQPPAAILTDLDVIITRAQDSSAVYYDYAWIVVRAKSST